MVAHAAYRHHCAAPPRPSLADVPWSEEKPSKGGWMPAQTIDYLLEEVAAGRFYILCPDHDVTREMDAKRIAWAAGDIIAVSYTHLTLPTNDLV